MEIGVISINHDTATVAQREKCHMTEGRKIEFLNELMQLDLLESSLLATCGRFEIYYVTTKESFSSGTDAILTVLSEFSDPNIYQIEKGLDAIKHLFKVTTGMASAVLGEDQILGQVKESILFSNQCCASGKILNKVFRDAITFAKRVKTDLKISEVPISLSYIAIKKSKDVVSYENKPTITMVGLGKMGKLAIQYLLEESFAELYVCVRNPEKLPEFILTDPRIHIVPFDDRYTYIAKSHVVVSSTAAPHAVIRKPFYTKSVEHQLIIDLAVPRDVCEALYEESGITVWDVDGLKETSTENVARRKELLAQVEHWLEDECLKSQNWVEMTKVDDVLRGWHNDIESITKQSLDRYKLDGESSIVFTEETLQRFLQSALKKMIRKPLENLKSIDNPVKREQSVQLLKELFEYDS